jgi:hypothetical protein
MMMAEANVTAYQDVFILSGILSLVNILPALLYKRRTRRASTTETTPRGVGTHAVKSH